MTITPKSSLFDDVYFSAYDGLGETKHVFLEGTGLVQTWQAQTFQGFSAKTTQNFVITELGFGTGLNFLATWKEFDDHAPSHLGLHYISIEKHPLSPQDISRYLQPWAAHFGKRLPCLLENYPIQVPGFHRIILSERVSLTLIFDDVEHALGALHPVHGTQVDCWYLDGFTPAKNPDMWTSCVFSHMARLSKEGSRFATFTAAGFVRRELEEVGFSVSKQPGFAKKREMLTGVYEGKNSNQNQNQSFLSSIKKVAIIGAGLAGTACSYILKQRGIDTVIYEAGDTIASGASGNSGGIYNPRFYAHRTELSDYYTACYAQSLRVLPVIQDIDHQRCGAAHLITNENKDKRFNKMLQNWGWHQDAMQMLDSQQTSEVSGVSIPYSSLYFPHSGYISPKKLCAAYAGSVEVRYNSALSWKDVELLDCDAIILANGPGSIPFLSCLPDAPLHTVRGQISYFEATQNSKKLQTALCYGGYLSPPYNGKHIVGSTFQKWLDCTEVSQEDHAHNLEKLHEAIPALSDIKKVVEGRAALRTVTSDHFPVVGHVRDNVYVTTGHGSHGIVTSLSAAHHLADLILGTPQSLSSETIDALSPKRFFDRKR